MHHGPFPSIVADTDRARAAAPPRPRASTAKALRALHRTSALAIGLFAAMHIANHLFALAGVPAHLAFMDAARVVYRQPAVEAVLLGCVAFQGASGVWLLLAGWKARRGALQWLQAASGAYLALFLLIHVAAIFYGRALGLDTNFYYAAAGFQVPPFQYFFAPYYFLAVLALFTHVGCALARRASKGPPRALAIAVPMLAGLVISSLLLACLAGFVHPFEVPAKYKQIYHAVR
jgi:succinate dehydrogenase/fumarate reductase cytochrome b subunit